MELGPHICVSIDRRNRRKFELAVSKVTFPKKHGLVVAIG